jgi:integrase
MRCLPLRRFFVDELARHVPGLDPNELVFRSPKDGPLRNSNFRDRFFDKAVVACGLEGLTPHDLRTPRRAWLAHASAGMTLDVYAGLFGDDLGAVAERLD